MSDRSKLVLAACAVAAVFAMANCSARETEAKYRYEIECFKAGGLMSNWTNRCIPKGARP